MNKHLLLRGGIFVSAPPKTIYNFNFTRLICSSNRANELIARVPESVEIRSSLINGKFFFKKPRRRVRGPRKQYFQKQYYTRIQWTRSAGL